jgi:glycosyltransferase involved in cell wall biosynthesis
VLALEQQAGVRVTVLSLGTGMSSIGRSPVVDLPFPVRIGPLRFGLAVPFVRRAIRRIAPDLVLGYRIPSYGVLAFLSGFRPVVLVAQSETELWPPALELKRFLLGRIVPRAALVQVWAPSMEPSLIALGARPERMLCLPRGIDVDLFSPGRDLRTQPFARGGSPSENPAPPIEPSVPKQVSGPIQMIVTRTLHEDYNHWHILRAMAQLRAEGLETRLDVVGDGPLRAEIEAEAARVVPGAVTFHGRTPHAALPALLRRADLYLSTPITEGLSASLVEAMGCGAFPIVTDHPGNRQLVEDGKNGRLVPVGDVPALVRAIRAAWEAPGLRADAAVRNRAYVESHMRADRNVARMVERYREVVASARPGGRT